MRTSSICCRSFRQDASVTQASKPVLHLHTLLVLAALGRSKNTVMPSPKQKDRLYSVSASELRNCGRAKPSHVLSMVHWFFFFFQNKKNIERPDGIYLPPYCKQRQRRKRRIVLGRWGREASPPVLAVILAKSRQQEKHGFLHIVSELSRLESASMVTILFLLLTISGGGRGSAGLCSTRSRRGGGRG